VTGNYLAERHFETTFGHLPELGNTLYDIDESAAEFCRKEKKRGSALKLAG
jgi:hypothetical protein